MRAAPGPVVAQMRQITGAFVLEGISNKGQPTLATCSPEWRTSMLRSDAAPI